MKLNREDKFRYLYEYAFYDVIREHNEAEKATGNPDYIMASEGRVLRERLGKRLESIGKSMETTSVAEFRDAVNAVVGPRIGGPVYVADGHGSERAQSKRQLGEFMAMVGLERGTETEVSGEGHFLPISPYDPRFSMNDAVMDNGTYLGGIAVDDPAVESSSDLIRVGSSTRAKYLGNLHMNRDGAWVARETNRPLKNKADMLGMTNLKRFMSDADYRKCTQWVERGFDLSSMTRADVMTHRRSVQRAVAILDELDQEGREYTISPDMNPGQLKATIDGTRVSVRVMDTPKDSRAIGRVYDNGAKILLKTTGYSSLADAPEPYVDETVAMVRYGLGEPVERFDGKGLVGELDTFTRKASGRVTPTYGSYRTSDGTRAIIGRPYRNANGKRDYYGNQLYISVDTKDRSRETTSMPTELDAANYLEAAVSSAAENYAVELDVERIIADVAEHGHDEDFTPTLSGDDEVAAVQQSYYDVLLGNKSTLMRPGHDADEFEERLSEVGELETGDAVADTMYRNELDHLTYPSDMDPAEMVREHARDMVGYRIGSYDMDADGKRFNPVGVARYQTSAYGVYRNNDDLVKAMRMLNVKPEELKGDDFYTQTMKSKLVKFDMMHARRMKDEQSPFMRSMYQEVHDSLKSNGVAFKDEDILIDDNGIVHYAGEIATKAKAGADGRNGMTRIEGELGQIFEPDEHGIVYTNFSGIDNYAFVPGYTAHILRQKPGESKTVEERTRLRGYEQAMRESIRYRMRQDLLTANGFGSYGSPTSVNDTYRRLYDERHDYDFVDKFREQGMEDDMLWAIVRTEGQRVRYPNSVRDGSTIHAAYTADKFGRDMANDNTGDPFVLTGGRNMAKLTSESDGYFDPIATTATSTNQGTLRYLVDGAKVTADGRIEPSEDKGARCAIMNHPIARYMAFNPFDRQNMTISNLMQASAVTRPVNVAQMTFGGWTMDDQVVVTKRFADEYKIRMRDGRLRSMANGDKVTDPYGNKGVVYVMDQDMSDEDAEAAGIAEQVKWLRANPDLDVVMAPFPSVSRFNGGTAHELMEHPQNLNTPDGEVIPGAMGAMRIIVTDKSADAKTHVYDDAHVGGRKASAQLGWALNAKDASAIMRECFGNNGPVLANIREQLITCGLDISETGQFRVGYQPHEGETRRVIGMPELAYKTLQSGDKLTASGRPSLDKKAMAEDFAETIAKSGGVMEVPFELKFPTGDVIAPLNDDKTDVIHTPEEWAAKGYTDKDGVHRASGRAVEGTTWGLPVMSSYLRSGQTFEDGTSSTHDYTHQYINIFEQANMYRACEEQLGRDDLSDAFRKTLRETMTKAQAAAQGSFDRITGDVMRRSFSGKHNVFRDQVMAHKMPNSATAIWNADPRLDIDQVAVGRAMADSIGLKDDDYALIWRDPILRDGGVRYMRVKVDDSLTGVAINPVMDKSFDGDFDGDTVAVVNLMTPSARKEAMEKFSVEANLLDYGVKSDDPEKPFDLSMQQSLDVKAAFANRSDKHYRERFDNIAKMVNENEADFAAGNMTHDEITAFRRETVEALSGLYHETFEGQCGAATIRYDSAEHHLESIKEACIDTGAKGKPAALLNYAQWAGISTPNATEQNLDFTGAEMDDHTHMTRDANIQTMQACAVKSFGTGIAGSYSQRGVSAMRNVCQKAVSELTAPVTQSLLQAKHDAQEANHKYELLMGPVRDLWRGAEMSYDEDKHVWSPVRNEDGTLVQAERNDWVKTFKEMYSSKEGLNVAFNADYVDQVADALTDETGHIRNMEDEGCDMVAPLDRLAYGGDFKMLVGMCREGKNLFEGKYDSQFAPRSVDMNKRILEAREAGEEMTVERDGETVARSMHAFTKTDTVESGHDRKVGHAKSVSVGPRRLPTNDIHYDVDDTGHDGLC